MSDYAMYGYASCFLAYTSENRKDRCTTTSRINSSEIRPEPKSIWSRIPVMFARMRQESVDIQHPAYCNIAGPIVASTIDLRLAFAETVAPEREFVQTTISNLVVEDL